MQSLENGRILIKDRCPVCDDFIQYILKHKELEIAKNSLSFVNKAKFHESCSHVVIVHIDWQGRVRRKNAYPFETKDNSIPSENVDNFECLPLMDILSKMDGASKAQGDD